MAIWDETIKIPVVRRITTGEKVKTSSGVTRGKKLTHFMAKVYNPNEGEYVKDQEFFNQYGDEPVKIPIELLHDHIDQMLTVELIMFTSASATPYCISRDGEKAIRNGKEIKCGHMNCDYYKKGQCKANVRFYFSLQHNFHVLGETMFMSSSIENYINIRSALLRLAEDTKKYSKFKKSYLAGLQLELSGLYRQKKYVGLDGKPHSTSVMLVYLEMPNIKGHLDYETKIREFVRSREEGIIEAITEPKITHQIQGDEEKFRKDIVEEFYGVDSEGNVSPDEARAELDNAEGINKEPPPMESVSAEESVGESTGKVPGEEVPEEEPETAELTGSGAAKVISEIKDVEDVDKAVRVLAAFVELPPRFIESVEKYVEKVRAEENTQARAQQIRRIRERLLDVLNNGL